MQASTFRLKERRSKTWGVRECIYKSSREVTDNAPSKPTAQNIIPPAPFYLYRSKMFPITQLYDTVGHWSYEYVGWSDPTDTTQNHSYSGTFLLFQQPINH